VTHRHLRLGLAAAGLFLAALDAYAVVTLLPQMLGAVDLPIDHVEAAAPILSAFLGGYVVAMPLLGAFSDARGRLPAYAAGLGIFAAGSALTALAPSLPWLVVGRALQGLGGGALVPLSLALAADLYPAGRRGPAVGAVSALQEAGSVIGPIYGAGLAAGLHDWRPVFWLNLPLSALILAGLWLSMRQPARPDGGAVVPGSRHVEWPGALLLGSGLGALVLALYPDDPGNRPVNSHALLFGGVGVALLAAFAWRQARLLVPLIRPQLLRRRAFGGTLASNLLVGSALMVALVDVPVLARGVYDLDTLASGLVLVRFLVGVPIGALLGGWLAGRVGQRASAVAGMLLAAAAFGLLSSWGSTELSSAGLRASAELATCGLGFGLVIAPLSTALLDQARGGEHGLASSLVVLARTVGMVIALSALTAFGLARLQGILAARRCGVGAGGGSLRDQLIVYEDCVRGALLQEYREIFLVAAVICLAAAALALATLPSRAAGSRRGSLSAVPE
jgi:MFS family permease